MNVKSVGERNHLNFPRRFFSSEAKRLDLVLEHHGLSHVVKHADSCMGGGVVLTHDGLEVPHCEEKFFNGVTPLESVPVLRQH